MIKDSTMHCTNSYAFSWLTYFSLSALTAFFQVDLG